MNATENALGKLLVFLDKLETAKLWYRLGHFREAIMVEIAVPGVRWEVEFFDDCHIEVERFVSSGNIDDARILDTLFTELTDKVNEN